MDSKPIKQSSNSLRQCRPDASEYSGLEAGLRRGNLATGMPPNPVL
jgi:hypothetical protein